MSGAREKVLIALLLAFIVPLTASAHEFWLQPKAFWWQPAQSMPLSLRVGHGHHSERSKIPSRRITRFEVIGPSNEGVDLRSKYPSNAAGDMELRFDTPGAYVIALATDNQARSDLPADRFNEYLRAEGLTPALLAREQAGQTQAEGSERYSRQAKSIVQIGASQDPSRVTQAIGLRLEIVPEISPYAEPRPARLPVRVIFEGKPLPGALVKMSKLAGGSQGLSSLVTDEHGRAAFEMPSQGNWLLHVTWTKTLPSTDEADFDTVFSSLTFGLPKARPFTATDLVTLREIGAVTLSPNGRWLAWDQRQTELAANQVHTRVSLLDLERPNEPPRQLSLGGDHNARHPRFAADGEWIYILSDASGIDQLWRVPTQGGAAQRVSDFDVALAGYSLSPTGEQVAIWADVSTACNELPCTLPQPIESCCGTGRGFDDAYVQRWDAWRLQQARSTIYVPHWDAWMTPEIRSRVYVMSVNGGKATSAMGRWLGDSPSKAFGGAEQIAWSADGETLFFTLREAGRAERFSLNLDVLAARMGEPTSANLTGSNSGVDTLPAPSPDGRWLAYVSAHSANDASARKLQLRNLATGAVTPVADDWDASVRSIAWAADSRSLLVTARMGMDEPLFQISLEEQKVTRLTEEGRVTNVIPMAQGGAILALDTMLQPADLYQLSGDGRLVRLTAINEDHLRDIAIPRVERFDFKGARGATVSAWRMAPDASPDELPTVLLIHDGLHGEAANGWSRRWNPRLFSAPGYAVIGIDFHGTAGYGEASTDKPRIERDAMALEDLRLGLSAATKRFPGLNVQNVCIAGDGAYGGYLVYRIAGQWSRQPSCLITNGGVVDAATMSFQTDEPWIHDWLRAAEGSEREGPLNPLNFAEAWRTPLLILHGEKNFRVSHVQSLAAFTVAQRRNVPSRLVVFPDEGAWVQAPKNAIQWYGEVFNWLDRWLAADPRFTASSGSQREWSEPER